jgi:hypothetical protein
LRQRPGFEAGPFLIQGIGGFPDSGQSLLPASWRKRNLPLDRRNGDVDPGEDVR